MVLTFTSMTEKYKEHLQKIVNIIQEAIKSVLISYLVY